MRGRPFLGFFAGLIFGVFLAITLVLVGALPLNSVLVSVLPVLGMRLRPADRPRGRRSGATVARPAEGTSAHARL